MERLIFALLLLASGGNAIPTFAQDINPGHLYAVIISGGRNRLLNHERYWNDCAFLYRTLRHECQMAKEHITLLMADGDNPDADMLRDGGTGFMSSPTDLDGDGLPDLTLAATEDNLRATMERLSAQLTQRDHLFLYITDHGELSEQGEGILSLWAGGRITSHQIAELLKPLRVKTMNILLGQCYAGAFVHDLQAEGRLVTISCGATELAWSCPDRPYNEFVYHWICAIARHDEHGNAVDADLNSDNRITMDEAFSYARQHDRRPETPAISCWPQSIDRQWSFDDMALRAAVRQPTANSHNHAIYHLDGRRLSEVPRQGVYIKEGRKNYKKR